MSFDLTKLITVQMKAQANAARAKENAQRGRRSGIEELTVTTISGKVFNAGRDAMSLLTTAVVLGEAGISKSWRLEDDTVEVITWEELKEALILVAAAQTALIIAED